MKFFCLGDSLTAGYGVPAPDCWVARVAQRTGWNMINAGEVGETSWGMLYRFRRDRSRWTARPDALFVMGGSNDLLREGTDRLLLRNMADLLDAAAESALPIILGIPIPMLPSLARECWSPNIDYETAVFQERRYCAWLLEQAKAHGATVADFRPIVESRPPEAQAEMYLDGLHLKAPGHALMADMFIAAARPLVARLTGRE